MNVVDKDVDQMLDDIHTEAYEVGSTLLMLRLAADGVETHSDEPQVALDYLSCATTVLRRLEKRVYEIAGMVEGVQRSARSPEDAS